MYSRSRARMTMRCKVYRRQDLDGGRYNLGKVETTVLHESLSCYMSEWNAMRFTDVNRTTFVVGYRMLAPRDADIQANDFVELISDRASPTLLTTDRLRVVSPPVRTETHLVVEMESII